MFLALDITQLHQPKEDLHTHIKQNAPSWWWSIQQRAPQSIRPTRAWSLSVLLHSHTHYYTPTSSLFRVIGSRSLGARIISHTRSSAHCAPQSGGNKKRPSERSKLTGLYDAPSAHRYIHDVLRNYLRQRASLILFFTELYSSLSLSLADNARCSGANNLSIRGAQICIVRWERERDREIIIACARGERETGENNNVYYERSFVLLFFSLSLLSCQVQRTRSHFSIDSLLRERGTSR